MRVLAYPAFSVSESNPYTRLLYKEMKAEVADFSYRRAFTRRYDILHVHWPEWELNFYRNPVEVASRLRLKLFAIDYLRARGTKIVWTVHNLKAHDSLHPSIERRFWRSFVKRLDGFIALTNAGRESAREKFPALRGLPSFVIPHGHYRDQYSSNSRKDARTELGISAAAKVLLFFGRIREYKNIPLLLETFEKLQGDVILYIAGRPDSDDLAKRLMAAAAQDRRVRLHLDEVAEDQVQHFFRAANLVVLPYREILNSGTAMLALSFGRPVLVPDLGAMSELQAAFGSQWVRTYRQLTVSELQDALEWAITFPRATQPALEGVDWPTLAKRTLEAYTEVVRGSAAICERSASRAESRASAI
jgi:beta-1,4-mannosyltransferase